MPVPDAIRAAYGDLGNPTEPDPGTDHWSDPTPAEYRKLWQDQPPDPLDLASHCSAPWRQAGAPHWRDYPMGLPAPTTFGVVEQPTPQLLLAVDSYAGWYLELCRRGLDESDPVLVSVHIRALGTLGTFRIGGGYRPHLVVDA